ncbi:MAG: hypothetical protein Q7S40_28075 [Opitutaceae bacterium]|nr:hypothetical protein [Opitutaceae bacterium]
MNVPPAVVPAAGAKLHARRCARHPTREAAARCPSCREFFCRECVVEHAGRLLCSVCLGRATAAAEKRRERLAGVRRLTWTTTGVLVLWGVFYATGALLLKIPAEFHDGTMWRRAAAAVSEP